MTPDSLPFEYPFRWRNGELAERAGVDREAAAVLEQRDRDLEDYLAASVVPLVFHWHGQVDGYVDVRNGPGEFRRDGSIYLIRYRWDTAPAASATVQWQLDGVVAFTHTLTGGESVHVETPGQAYAQQAIVGIVTAVGADASGLSAFVYFAG